MEVYINGIPDSVTPVGISALGTLVYDNINFPAGSYTSDEGELKYYDEVTFDAVTVSVNRAKEIVSSKIAGRNGSIKEYVGHGDYYIRINAIIVPETFSITQAEAIAAGLIPGVSTVGGSLGVNATAEPTAKLYAVSELEKVPTRVEVESKFLNNIFEITYVVIDKISMERKDADSWMVTMNLISDFDTDLKDFG